MNDYLDFLERKTQDGADSGFAPLWMPDFLFDFQADLVEWAIRKGRCAIFADCGLGKTPMGLTWASNVARKTNKPALYLTPLAVGAQTVREAEKFGIDAKLSKEGSSAGHVHVPHIAKGFRTGPEFDVIIRRCGCCLQKTVRHLAHESGDFATPCASERFQN